MSYLYCIALHMFYPLLDLSLEKLQNGELKVLGDAGPTELEAGIVNIKFAELFLSSKINSQSKLS